jgi:hypothetical protein
VVVSVVPVVLVTVVPVVPVVSVAVVSAVLVTVDWDVAVQEQLPLQLLAPLTLQAQQLLRPLEQRKVPQNHRQLHLNQGASGASSFSGSCFCSACHR